MKQLLVIISLLFSAVVTAAPAWESTTVPVGVKTAKPFAYQEDGVWKGYSIEFLDELAKDAGFEYRLVDLKSMPELIQKTREASVAFSIAAISMTPAREKILDFSHPYFTTSQGIMTKPDTSNVWPMVQKIGLGLAVFVAILYVIGFIMDKGDGNDVIDNPHTGAWWALVTFSTTGYGDIVPKTPPGKILASLVIISSLFALPIFTAYITQAWTVQALTETPTTISDLAKMKPMTMPGTTSSRLLDREGIRHKTVENLDVAVDFLDGGMTKAVVYDKAMLDYIAQVSERDYNVWPAGQGLDRYAIAFPAGSPIKEAINVSILNVVDSDSWRAVTRRYFGTN